VAGAKLLARPHVQDDHGSRAHALEELLSANRLEVVQGAEVAPDQALHVAEPALGDRPQHAQQLEHLGIRQPILHEQPPLPALDEACLPQHL
jgi:hypothetical protein